MIHEITSAIVKAIEANRKSVVSSVMALVGAAAGSLWTAFVGKFARWGKIKIVDASFEGKIEDRFPVQTNQPLLGPPAPMVAKAKQLNYTLQVQLANTFADPKHFTVRDIRFYKKNLLLYSEIKPTTNVPVGPFINQQKASDGVIDAGGLIRIQYGGLWMERLSDAKKLEGWTHVELVLLIAPTKILRLRHIRPPSATRVYYVP